MNRRRIERIASKQSRRDGQPHEFSRSADEDLQRFAGGQNRANQQIASAIEPAWRASNHESLTSVDE
jgi:hypothetical protein